MKKLLLALSILILALQSCTTGKPADAGDILSTVPSDVSLVAVVNSAQLLEKMGCKVDGMTVTPGKDFDKNLDKISDKNLREFVSAIAGGNNGIDPSVLVIFREGYYTYVTGIVTDKDQFKTFAEKHTQDKFQTDNGIGLAGNVAVADNRFWINISGRNIDTNAIRHFSSLSASQSFLQNSYAENMISVVKDVEGWGNITGLLNTSGIDFQKRATYLVALQTVFDDPSAFSFSIDYQKDRTACEAFVLNSKGNKAKYLLPSEKIDVTAVSAIGGTANSVMAIGVPAKLVEKLRKETSSKAPSVFGVYLQQLGCVDGTAALAFGADEPAEHFRGVISTTGKETSGLVSMLSDLGIKAVPNGTVIDVSKGTVEGKSNVAEMADAFKGAVAGCVTDSADFGGFKASSASIMLYPSGSSLRFELKLTDN